MLELLNQLDGFDTRGDVKVIMATNKIESLDPALIRPGRIDRKIEFPLPDVKTKRHIFKYLCFFFLSFSMELTSHFFRLHTSRMTLASDVDLEEFIMTKDDLSGADIKAVCTEAGLLALRERRMRVTKVDFTAAREKASFDLVCWCTLKLTIALLRRYCTGRMRVHQKGFICDVALICFNDYIILIPILREMA
jgi:26S proteasome regulatory subunit T2